MPRKLTYEYVRDYINNTNECTLISSEYVNNNTDMDIMCACGNIFRTTFGRFTNLNKTKCDRCSGKAFSYDDVKEYVKENGCVLVSSDYNGLHKKIDIQCSCGNVFTTTFGKFRHMGKRKCNKCSLGRENQYLTGKDVKDYLSIFGAELLSEYVASNKKVDIRCSCGEIFSTTINKARSSGKVRCNKCTKSMSKIEILAEALLEKHQVAYSKQFTFSDLKTTPNTRLRFDFAVFNDDGSIRFLLELDGQQHFAPCDIFGGEEGFKSRLRNDAMKEKYCADNYITLVRIPYYRFNKINEELEKILRTC